MKRFRSILLVLIAPLALAACFSSDTPLIGPDEAAFPYEKIVYQGESSDEAQTLFRSGDGYGVEALDSPMRIRFMPAGPGYYIAQAEGTKGDETIRLYAFLKVDLTAMTAESFASLAPDNGAGLPGFTACADHQLCFDDLETYAAYARERIAAGAPPDVTYKIISLE